MRDYLSIPGIDDFGRHAKLRWAVNAALPFVAFGALAGVVTYLALKPLIPANAGMLAMLACVLVVAVGSSWNYGVERKAASARRIQFARAWVAAGGGAAQQDERWLSLKRDGWVLLAPQFAALGRSNRPTVGHNKSPVELLDARSNVNVDGTPMVGTVDIQGKAYGVTYNPATDSFTAHHGSYRSPLDS